MKITGRGTADGGAKFRKRFPEAEANGHFRTSAGLIFSSVGIGTYLGKPNDETDECYRKSVIRAVELGANVIDTAANYRCQRSERAIGSALRDLVELHEIDREQLVICTKGGYLAFDGHPPRDIRAYVEERFVNRGIAEFADFAGGSHCMTPAYLNDQLDHSLANLGLDCIDVYYVHNPEAQLASISRGQFEMGLATAFRQLEASRSLGKIQFYGVATWNGFRVDAAAKAYHSLERMVEFAIQAGGVDHGFRFIQLPFNFAMTEAISKQNQKEKGKFVSLIDAAAAYGITIVASASTLQGRVLSAIPENIRAPLGSLRTDAQTAIQFVRSTPGITTALIGMSSEDHVVENMELCKAPVVSQTDFQKVLQSISA